MDNQFTTLINSYSDNYLQYKMTGNPSYQNSYMSAEQGIQNLLAGLQDQVNAQNRQITSFYQSDVEGKLKEVQSQIKSAERGIAKGRDDVIEATMRSNPVSFQIPRSYYISIGVLTATAVLLLALR